MIDENIIPKDWKVKTLGEVCEKVETVKRKEKNIEEKFVYLDIGGIDNSLNKILHHKDYSWKDAPSRAQQIVFRNDILFSTVRTYMKNIALVDNINYDCQIASSGFCVIRGKKNIVNHKFIFYLTLSNHFLQPLNALQTGSSYPAVRDKDVFSQQIPLPPLAEQENIVSKIEELFSELDKSIENLRTVQQQLKTYRQAVLKWAFEGKLTEEKKEFHDPWKSRKLGKMFDFVGGGTPSKNEMQYWKGDIFWASVKDIKGDFLNKTQYTISEEGLRNSAANLAHPGDVILITRISPGKTVITNVKTAINQDLKIAKPKFNTTSKFIHYFFKSIERECIKIASGTTVLGITLNNLNELEMPELSIEEQDLIVQAIESRLSVTDKMEETINQSVQQAEALRQSILKKAFEGKLVTVKEQAKVIPIERKALACHIINLNHSHRYFGLTKFQKILYVCEQFAEVEYETYYEQERAGPYDREFTTSFKQEMSEEDWFQTETKVSLTHFLPGANAGKLSREYVKHFRPKGDKIRFVLGLLQEKTLFEAELIATIYAVWNNTIIKKLDLDIDAIISDVYNWSNEKAKYTKQDISGMFNWMNEVGLVPKGFGKEIKKAIN